ncbi:MAG TPA: metallophosphoesterase [Opitutaceae bacterium]|nr:metallophosphoesterase [Opitutaceae bacterium]
MNRRRFLQTTAAAIATAPLIARAAEADAFEIGLVADAQYADVEPKGTRFYRQSIGKLSAAIEYFNGRDLAFCAHLGDLIDRSENSFDAILKPFGQSRQRWHHLLGNHDFEVIDAEKARVPGRLAMPGRHSFFDHAGFRFVILDTNDVSVYAHAAGTPERAAAEKELARVQAAKLPQAQTWNGAIGGTQLAWFERTCREAKAASRRVIVLAHHPVLPAGQHVIWNAPETLAVVERQSNVVAWLNGHNHAGAFGERAGIPYVTMHGMIETIDTTAFATARILRDRMIIAGHGREPSRELKFRV